MRTIQHLPLLVLISSSVALAADPLQPDVDADALDAGDSIEVDALDAPIVGGTPTKTGAWPDAVAVIGANALCSGTLIAPDLVLTAGHCIDMHPQKVIVGTIDLAKPGGETLAVKSAIAYPDWQHRYDVGLVVLEKPAKAKPRAIAQACTATEQLATTKHVTVVGFGLTQKSGTGTNTQLHDAKMPIDDPTCAKDRACRPKPINPGAEFVAGGHGVDSCFGDSGAPAYVQTGHGPVLMGVVSRGIGTMATPCGQGGVIVRADKVVTWIEKAGKQKLARAKCDGAGAGSNQDDATDDSQGGCSASSGALGVGLLVIAAVMWILTTRRRREARVAR